MALAPALLFNNASKEVRNEAFSYETEPTLTPRSIITFKTLPSRHRRQLLLSGMKPVLMRK